MRKIGGPRRRPYAAMVDDIVEAVSHAKLTEYDAWNDLNALSSNTDVDGIDVDPAGVTLEGERFTGLATIYVASQYGTTGVDGFETSNAFEGHFDGKRPVIDKITVDTTPFYE